MAGKCKIGESRPENEKKGSRNARRQPRIRYLLSAFTIHRGSLARDIPNQAVAAAVANRFVINRDVWLATDQIDSILAVCEDTDLLQSTSFA